MRTKTPIDFSTYQQGLTERERSLLAAIRQAGYDVQEASIECKRNFWTQRRAIVRRAS